MTNQHLTTALANQADTCDWLRTPQAATMAQLDKQMRGTDAGLTPGDDNAEALADWITQRYGTLPEATGLDRVTDAARQAGRVRQWQADRLENSAVVAVHGDVATVAARLAHSGSFTSTPQLPEFLPDCVTLVWPDSLTAYGTHTVTGPGALPGENMVCAITIDQATGRIIEWSPTDLDFGGNIQHLLDTSDATLPPWLPAADEAYTADDTRVEQWQARIMAAAAWSAEVANNPTAETEPHSSLLEQANATIAAMTAGLVSVKRMEGGFVLDQP